MGEIPTQRTFKIPSIKERTNLQTEHENERSDLKASFLPSGHLPAHF